MTRSVSLPVWLVVVLALLATWAALDRLLVPSVRWYLRRRVNRAIDELNTRLRLEIRPFLGGGTRRSPATCWRTCGPLYRSRGSAKETIVG